MATLIAPSKYHRTLDGRELEKARTAIGMSQGSFAALCGWSQQFQCQLESPGDENDYQHEITIVTAIQIEKVLHQHKL